MPIQFTCVCGKTLRVHDDAVGKRVRCPDCDMTVAVPEAVNLEIADDERPRRQFDENERPRRRRVQWADDRPRSRRKPSSSSAWWIVGIVGGVLFLIVAGCVGGLLMSVHKIRNAANLVRRTNNLKILAVGIEHYNDIHNHFPSQAIYSKRGKPLLSWRVAILPYIEQAQLYQQFRLDEPWDSPHNKRLLPFMPKVYAPLEASDSDQGLTQCLAFVGKHTVITNTPGKPVTLGTVTDGTSNTLLLGLATREVPWTKPEDMLFEPGDPPPPLDDSLTDRYLVVFADGSVRVLQREIPPRALEALITRDGGEIETGAAWTKQRS